MWYDYITENRISMTCWFCKHVFISALTVFWEEAVSLAICAALIFSDLYRILHHEYIPMPPQQNNADVIIQSIGNLIVVFKKFVVFSRKTWNIEKEKERRKRVLHIIMIPSLVEYIYSLFLSFKNCWIKYYMRLF